jgi:hypothetical protein
MRAELVEAPFDKLRADGGDTLATDRQLPRQGAPPMTNYQAPTNPGGVDPGKTLGLVGMILAIIPCTYFIGLILSVVAFVMSNRVGIRNQRAIIGIVIGAIWLVISIILQITGFWSGVFTTR